MLKTVQLGFGLLLLVLTGMAGQVMAHQQKEAITTVLFNDRTGNIEVAHRFYIHDAEHAVKHIVKDKKKGPTDLIKDKTVQSAFAAYAVSRFSLALNGQKPLSLRLLGQEVEGKFLWVYQESPNLTAPYRLDIHNEVLMEIWPSQRNIVNVEGLGAVKSVQLQSFQPFESITINKSGG